MCAVERQGKPTSATCSQSLKHLKQNSKEKRLTTYTYTHRLTHRAVESSKMPKNLKQKVSKKSTSVLW